MKRTTSHSNRADRVGEGSRGRVWQRLFAAAPSERGQALIEFALILPILLVLMFVVLDFGLALDRRQVIQHAVREGARQAAVGLGEADVKLVVKGQSQEVLGVNDVNICYVAGPSGAPFGFAGSNVRVSATYLWRFSLGSELLNAFGVDPDTLAITMTPSAEARLETSNAGAKVC